MPDTDHLLANVLADAFAHHEAARGEGPERSLVLAGEGNETGAWVGAYLDFERAGQVAASVLELAGETLDGRPLFTIPVRLSAPPERTDATADGSETSAVAHSDENLVGRIMGAAREVFTVHAVKHQWLLREIRRFHPGATLAELQSLTDDQLRVILDKLDGERRVHALRELGPGVHSAPPGTSARADAAFASLRASDPVT